MSTITTTDNSTTNTTIMNVSTQSIDSIIEAVNSNSFGGTVCVNSSMEEATEVVVVEGARSPVEMMEIDEPHQTTFASPLMDENQNFFSDDDNYGHSSLSTNDHTMSVSDATEYLTGQDDSISVTDMESQPEENQTMNPGPITKRKYQKQKDKKLSEGFSEKEVAKALNIKASFEPFLQKLQDKQKELKDLEKSKEHKAKEECLQEAAKKAKKKQKRLPPGKKPMNVMAIRTKLRSLHYMDEWHLVDDLWAALENSSDFPKALQSNRNLRLKIAENTTTTATLGFYDFFVHEIDLFMRNLGFCCGRKYTFEPATKFCFSEGCCLILKDDVYYKCSVPLNNKQSNQFEYYSCKCCFEKIPGNIVRVTSFGLKNELTLEKSRFEKVKNDVLVPEEKIPCTQCNRSSHTICVNYSLRLMCRNIYVCKQCAKGKELRKSEKIISALSIRQTEMSIFIEKKINFFLQSYEKVAKLREPNRPMAAIGRVRVRLVLNEKRELRIKDHMFQQYGHKNDTFSRKETFQMKTILVFQSMRREDENSDVSKDDNNLCSADVCFFALQVQEYDHIHGGPNSRRIYISYLDSVRLFQPSECRTAVYHEIVLAYLNYIKELGYRSVHIWACPPQSSNDDYIFYRHPIEQKIPDPVRLQTWYKKMLNLGQKRGIFKRVSNLYEWSSVKQIQHVYDMPMFSEDYWYNHLEDLLVKDSKNVRLSKKPNPMICDKKLFDQFQDLMKKFGDAFLVGQFIDENDQCYFRRDPDPCIQNELLRSRESILRFFRENNLESSTLRRAIFTGTELINAIAVNGTYPYEYTCDNCMEQIEIGQHCNVCVDYDLCEECYEKLGGHLHETEVIMADVIMHESVQTRLDGTDYTQKDEKVFRLWNHSMFCNSGQSSCSVKYCDFIRNKLEHYEICDLQPAGGCDTCLRVEVVWLLHAEKCENENCTKNCRLGKEEFNDPAIRRRKQKIRRKYVLNNLNPQITYVQTSDAFYYSRVAKMKACSPHLIGC